MQLITATALTALLTSFVTTRAVQATPLNRQEYNDLRGWQVPADENPADDGYLVVNSGVSDRNVEGFDGYVSWLPKLAFEEQYKNDNLTFGQAVELLKGGKKVARKSWNGKGTYLLLATGIDFETKADLSDMQNENGELTAPSIAKKTADNKFVVGWLASQTDMLAEDWVVVQ